MSRININTANPAAVVDTDVIRNAAKKAIKNGNRAAYLTALQKVETTAFAANDRHGLRIIEDCKAAVEEANVERIYNRPVPSERQKANLERLLKTVKPLPRRV